MKKLIPLILTAAMTLTLAACTAAPDPHPSPPPRRSQRAAAAAPNACPRCCRFYTLKSYNGSFDDGTAYIRVHAADRLRAAAQDRLRRGGSVRLLRCPRLRPRYRRLPGLFPGTARPVIRWSRRGTTVYVWHISFVYDDQSWDDYWAEKLASGTEIRSPLTP